jgi:uncharacterized protein YukE
MGFLGLDVAAIRHLARQLDTQSNEVALAANELTQAIDATSWFGSDQASFVQQWESVHRPALTRASELLGTASSIAQQSAVDQERTSGA